MPRLGFGAVVFALAVSSSATASATVITFEGLSDSEILTNQIAGLTFTDALVLSAGISLNEFEFPPRSGSNVAGDLDGSVRIDFASTVPAFSAFFTYLFPLTITVYDSGDNPLAIAVSAFNSNLALSGDPGSSPNEFLQVIASNIAYVDITGGDPAGNSFVFDDVRLSPVPEPGMLTLLMIAGAAVFARRRCGQRSGSNL